MSTGNQHTSARAAGHRAGNDAEGAAASLCAEPLGHYGNGLGVRTNDAASDRKICNHRAVGDCRILDVLGKRVVSTFARELIGREGRCDLFA